LYFKHNALRKFQKITEAISQKGFWVVGWKQSQEVVVQNATSRGKNSQYSSDIEIFRDTCLPILVCLGDDFNCCA
jgi:hypothetical protein